MKGILYDIDIEYIMRFYNIIKLYYMILCKM